MPMFKPGLFRIELHLHLDGACRPETLWDTVRERKMIDIEKRFKSKENFISELRVTGSGSLPKFIKTFDVFLPILSGHRKSIKRIALELCEDKAKEGVAYFEASYCPHLLADELRGVTAEEVVKNVNEAFFEGHNRFGVKANSILCMLIGKPEWCAEVVRLCQIYKHHGVVGIGLAGNELEPLQQEYFDGMDEACRLKINRSIHAGEAVPAPAANIRRAIETFKAHRIGHGYRCVDDDNVYTLVKTSKVHLEVCPTSSVRLGSVSSDFKLHPAKKFARDNINFSLNTDDPLHFNNTVGDEEEIALKYFGMSEEDILKARIRAAEASFLSDEDKQILVKHIKKNSTRPNSEQPCCCSIL